MSSHNSEITAFKLHVAIFAIKSMNVFVSEYIWNGFHGVSECGLYVWCAVLYNAFVFCGLYIFFIYLQYFYAFPNSRFRSNYERIQLPCYIHVSTSQKTQRIPDYLISNFVFSVCTQLYYLSWAPPTKIKYFLSKTSLVFAIN